MQESEALVPAGLAPGVVRLADLLGEQPIPVEGGVLVDRHRWLGGLAGTGLELGRRGAVLAGPGQCGVTQVVDREVGAAGLLPGRTIADHQVAGAHVVGAVAREQEAL